MNTTSLDLRIDAAVQDMFRMSINAHAKPLVVNTLQPRRCFDMLRIIFIDPQQGRHRGGSVDGRSRHSAGSLARIVATSVTACAIPQEPLKPCGHVRWQGQGYSPSLKTGGPENHGGHNEPASRLV
eukprot:14411955-Heterocapsa_arctica.AAC.1